MERIQTWSASIVYEETRRIFSEFVLSFFPVYATIQHTAGYVPRQGKMTNVFPASALAFDTVILSWCFVLSHFLLQPPRLFAPVLPECKVRPDDEPFQLGVRARSGVCGRSPLAATSLNPRSVFRRAVSNGESMFTISRFRASRGEPALTRINTN